MSLGVGLHGGVQASGNTVPGFVFSALIVRMDTEPSDLDVPLLGNSAERSDMRPRAVPNEDILAVSVCGDDRVAPQMGRLVPDPLLDPARYIALIFRRSTLEALGETSVVLPQPPNLEPDRSSSAFEGQRRLR
jgi:hypothetical protein